MSCDAHVALDDWIVDRTGFPLVRLDDRACWFPVLPVTKRQFERFMADVATRGEYRAYGNKWYDEVLAQNERATIGRLPPGAATLPVERLFMTGAWPEEVRDFATWLGERDGEQYDLASDEEWCAGYRQFSAWRVDVSAPTPNLLRALEGGPPAALMDRIAPEAIAVLKRLAEQATGNTLAHVGLMHRGASGSGLLNWVWEDDGRVDAAGLPLTYGGRGSSLNFAVDDPSQPDALWRPSRLERPHLYGFRLVRVGYPPLTNQES